MHFKTSFLVKTQPYLYRAVKLGGLRALRQSRVVSMHDERLEVLRHKVRELSQEEIGLVDLHVGAQFCDRQIPKFFPEKFLNGQIIFFFSY